jgi:hypothetical protein
MTKKKPKFNNRALLKLVKKSKEYREWDLLNQILYDLCSNYPHHKLDSEIIAKINIIGRVYAAAIERRKNKKADTDDFYLEEVAPKIRKFKFDKVLSKLKKTDQLNFETLPVIIEVHGEVTKIFKKISGMDKRSLASKYLHFHYPHLFFIYDSRAVKGLRAYSQIVGKTESQPILRGDQDYLKFSNKCLKLKTYISTELGEDLTLREFDNLLLKTPIGQ